MGLMKELQRISLWRKSGGKGPAPLPQVPETEVVSFSQPPIAQAAEPAGGNSTQPAPQPLSHAACSPGNGGQAAVAVDLDMAIVNAEAAAAAHRSPSVVAVSARPPRLEAARPPRLEAEALQESPAQRSDTDKLSLKREPSYASTAASSSQGMLSLDDPLESAGSLKREPSFESTLAPRAASRGSSNQGLFSFDVPLEEVHANAGEVFGPMIAFSLRSTKWDKRVQAMKTIGPMLRDPGTGSDSKRKKGRQLRERVDRWRVACQLLNHVMSDRVIPVKMATHELFMDAFANTADFNRNEVVYALEVLFPHLFERLGDTNLRMHESARKCFLFCAERPDLLGLEGVLSILHSRLNASCGCAESAAFTATFTGNFTKSGKKMSKNVSKAQEKALFGILDTVKFLLKHFPGQRESQRDAADDEELFGEDDADEMSPGSGSWTQDDVAGFVVVGMDDGSPHRVRQCALQLAVLLYQTFGMQALQPMMETLRPAKQALLRQTFKESEEDEEEVPVWDDEGSDDGEEISAPGFEDLMVLGRSMKPPCGLQLPPLGCTAPIPRLIDEDPEEECLMDGILEEAGMVFNGANITQELAYATTDSFDLYGRSLERQHLLLEQELMDIGMGLEMDTMDEHQWQQAVLNSLQDGPHCRRQVIEACS